MDKAKGKRSEQSQGGTDSQTKADTLKDGDGRIWVREDGAICIENECVVIRSAQDGAAEITIDPDKCSCKSGDAFYKTVLESALSGKGTRITIKPKE